VRDYQRAKQRLTVAVAFLAWLADRGRHLDECTQHDLDEWFGTGPTTRRHVITFLSWALQQRIISGVDVLVISTDGAGTGPLGTPRTGWSALVVSTDTKRGAGQIFGVMCRDAPNVWAARLAGAHPS
jgi:hypothetical protein